MSDRAGNLENKDNKLASKHLSGKIACSRSRILNHNVLLPDGSLVLCCNDFGLDYVLGNLNTDTYDDSGVKRYLLLTMLFLENFI